DKIFGGRKRSETSSVSSTRENTNRLSFGGSIRLNDLLNDDDVYGFAEEATEASLREYESDDHLRAVTITDLEMLIEDSPKEEHPAASSCPSSLTAPSVAVGYRSVVMHEEFDGGLLYSSRDRLDELTGAGTSSGLAGSSTAVVSSGGSAGEKEGDKVERISLGGLSVGSHDSRDGSNKSSSDGSSAGVPAKEKSKGLGALIDKAKHRLGGSKEREKRANSKENSQEMIVPKETEKLQVETSIANRRPSSLSIDGASAKEDKLTPMLHLVTHHITQLPFHQTRLYTGALLVAMTMAWPGFLVGILWGMYISGVAFLFFFVSDPKDGEDDDKNERCTEDKQGKMNHVDDACEVFEDPPIGSMRLAQPLVVYRGWMNELPLTTRYDPSKYHVNSCRCVLVRLEGTTLRISRPSRAVLKHAFHTDPTLTATPPSMVAQSIYDLTEATVSLRPRRLARLRWWSRKYPIYIKLKDERNEADKLSNKRRKRRDVPRMKRSISMHPSSSGIAEAAAAGKERVRREEGDRRVESEDEWTTTESDWEDEESELRNSSVVARARSSTEISGVGSEKPLGNCPSASSLRRSERIKPRGIYLFARAAREKERWFHLLREACAKARVARSHSTSGNFDGIAVARSKSTSTMTESLDMSPPLTPAEKLKRRESSGGGVEAEMDATTSAAREYMLYKSNQAHFARSMSDAMGISLSVLAKMAAVSSVAPTAGSSSNGNGAASATTPAGARAAMMMRDASLEDDTQSVNLGSVRWKPSALPEGNADLVASVNAIAGRIFFDFCRDKYWCAQVKEKIQTKLATIHLPYFIENLELSSLDLGTTTPHIESVHAPVCDEWGLWVDFEMKYSGGIRLALETRVNLLKLQSAADENENAEESQSSSCTKRSNRPATRYSDEDLPESPEDSPDEDFGAKMSAEKEKETTPRERAASKIVSLVESAARSSIFQKAAKLSKVAKVITDISSTRLILNVEVEAIEGTMTVNLPPPPSDRIWCELILNHQAAVIRNCFYLSYFRYAFRKRPKVSIRAIPQVGDRSVDLTTVSDWIESKLRLLIEKNLVCPNMDDIIIPAMSGNELLKMNYNQ
ncbi:hypothetical protein PMAYCL1PPCAC_09831, partial [Pristionchus mayeri]